MVGVCGAAVRLLRDQDGARAGQVAHGRVLRAVTAQDEGALRAHLRPALHPDLVDVAPGKGRHAGSPRACAEPSTRSSERRDGPGGAARRRLGRDHVWLGAPGLCSSQPAATPGNEHGARGHSRSPAAGSDAAPAEPARGGAAPGTRARCGRGGQSIRCGLGLNVSARRSRGPGARLAAAARKPAAGRRRVCSHAR